VRARRLGAGEWGLVGALLAVWGAFVVGVKTGRGAAWDRTEEVREQRQAVAAFHEALHQCTDSLARVAP
jgi:hypothetical protein